MVDFDTNGMAIVGRIDLIRKKKNISREAITTHCGISKTSLPVWASRGTIPAADVAIRIADFLGVSVYWLVTGHDRGGLTAEDLQLLDSFHLLDARDRDDLLAIARMKLERSTSHEGEMTEKFSHAG